MVFSYGQGTYTEGEKRLAGEVMLGEHKLYLRGPEGDLSQSYIPLEKIEKIKKVFNGIEISVRPSLMVCYKALIHTEKTRIRDLINDIVRARGLKKRFLFNEWVDAS